jgi:hypothetical protein
MAYPEKLFPSLLTETELFTLQPATFLVRDEAHNLVSKDILGESPQVAVINNTRKWPNNNQQRKTEVAQRRACSGAFHRRSHMKSREIEP